MLLRYFNLFFVYLLLVLKRFVIKVLEINIFVFLKLLKDSENILAGKGFQCVSKKESCFKASHIPGIFIQSKQMTIFLDHSNFQIKSKPRLHKTNFLR